MKKWTNPYVHLDQWGKCRSLLVIAMGAIALVRLAVLYGTGYLGRTEGIEMAEIAARINEGYGFASPYGPLRHSPTTVEPPLYVWITAATYYFLGVKSWASGLVLQCLNIVIQCATFILISRIIKERFLPAALPIFSILFILHPLLIFAAGNTWENCLTSLLLTVIAYEILFHWNADLPLVRFGLFGALLGLTSLSNSTWTIGYPFICLGGLYGAAQLRGWRVFKSLSIIVLGFALVTIPWIARNYVVTERFVFVRGMAGPELYKGNSPEAWGGHGVGFVENFLLGNKHEVAKLLEMGEVAYDDHMMDMALREIRTNPQGYLLRSAARIVMWWTGDIENTIWRSENGGRAQFIMAIISVLACSITSLFGILGWLAARKGSRGVWILSLYCFLLPMPYYAVTVGFRFRSTLTPFLLVFAAYWFAERLLARCSRDEGTFGVGAHS
jgi:4-amino-4-deoxy-L-arabinose transferase-like glycosyltransferase